MKTNVTENDSICILIGLLIHVTAVFLSLISQEKQPCCSEDEVCGLAAKKTLAKSPVIRNINDYDSNNDSKKTMCASLFLAFHKVSQFLLFFQCDPCDPVTKWTADVFKIDHQTINLEKPWLYACYLLLLVLARMCSCILYKIPCIKCKKDIFSSWFS